MTAKTADTRNGSEEERFLALVGAINKADPKLTPVGAGLLAALYLGVCTDSRSFARIVGIAHALVLREITELTERELIHIISRNERTQRTELLLTPAGKQLVSVAALL